DDVAAAEAAGEGVILVAILRKLDSFVLLAGLGDVEVVVLDKGVELLVGGEVAVIALGPAAETLEAEAALLLLRLILHGAFLALEDFIDQAHLVVAEALVLVGFAVFFLVLLAFHKL